jgi:RNA polymerase sigma-70 factor (ECF subfamily)
MLMASSIFDENYLQALAAGNEDAENYLLACFSRPVQLTLWTRLRSPELIQDAYQETFLRVLAYFRSGKTLDNPASLPGFVHTVCRNTALELLRGHMRHDQMPEHIAAPVDLAPNPEGEMIADERKWVVRQLLSELPEKDRELLRRVFLEEEDKDLVCAEFQIDRGYLRVLLHRARIRFRAKLLETNWSKVAPRLRMRDGKRHKLIAC